MVAENHRDGERPKPIQLGHVAERGRGIAQYGAIAAMYGSVPVVDGEG